MAKKLVSLNDHNQRILERHMNPPKHLNGIACPKCGCELYDSQPNMVLTSNPPQKHVACTSCTFTDTRYC